jgi:hypothetical protein
VAQMVDDMSHVQIDVAPPEIGISARRAVLTMATVTGGIWMLENVDR